MLDEMSLGLAPIVLKRLVPLVEELAERGVGVLLVEQYAHLALAHGDRVYVLSRGEIAYEGACRELVDDPERLRALYLGGPGSNGDGPQPGPDQNPTVGTEEVPAGP
jgi:branched-chain amino acid transport system ATP-binding protein